MFGGTSDSFKNRICSACVHFHITKTGCTSISKRLFHAHPVVPRQGVHGAAVGVEVSREFVAGGRG